MVVAVDKIDKKKSASILHDLPEVVGIPANLGRSMLLEPVRTYEPAAAPTTTRRRPDGPI